MSEQNAQHVMFEVFFENYPRQLEDLGFWEKLGATALEKGKFTIHHSRMHKFEPQGASGFWLLSESHLSFHTWPEKKHIFIDLFSCGCHQNTRLAADILHDEMEKMGGQILNKNILKRGFLFEN